MADGADDDGGDPACWAAYLCPACGAFVEDQRAVRCPRCAAELDREG